MTEAAKRRLLLATARVPTSDTLVGIVERMSNTLVVCKVRATEEHLGVRLIRRVLGHLRAVVDGAR